MVIVNKLREYNFNVEEAIKQLRSNHHNKITTTYYLLIKCNAKKGGTSISDKTSTEFVNYINNYKQRYIALLLII